MLKWRHVSNWLLGGGGAGTQGQFDFSKTAQSGLIVLLEDI